jgi:hypothetical protein
LELNLNFPPVRRFPVWSNVLMLWISGEEGGLQ